MNGDEAGNDGTKCCSEVQLGELGSPLLTPLSPDEKKIDKPRTPAFWNSTLMRFM